MFKLTEVPKWNLVKIAQAVSEKKTFENYKSLYICKVQGQGQIPARDKILIVTKTFYN